jgi:hypothetical protein
MECVALLLILATIGLLIARSMRHRTVEAGEESNEVLAAATFFAGTALLPLIAGLGLDLYVTLYRILWQCCGAALRRRILRSGFRTLVWHPPMARDGRTSRAARLVAPPGQTDNIPGFTPDPRAPEANYLFFSSRLTSRARLQTSTAVLACVLYGLIIRVAGNLGSQARDASFFVDPILNPIPQHLPLPGRR